MSTDVNTRLLETAAELIDYWQGSITAKMIEAAVDAQDFDALYELCRVAHYEMLQKEYQPGEMNV